MRASTVALISGLGLANADLCRYRIRSYGTPSCNNGAYNDVTLNSRDCFNLNNVLDHSVSYIWIDSINGTDYCTHGNWIREYKNSRNWGTCSSNNRGQKDVAIGKCEKLAHGDSDSIRINYA